MDRLPILYQQMSDMTAPLCGNCNNECSKQKYWCCEQKYCELAKKFAKEKYGVDLEPTGNPNLLFMGETGCIVPPHLRPVCTLHTCFISWADKSNINSDEEKTNKYFMLREEVLKEAAVQGKSPDFI